MKNFIRIAILLLCLLSVSALQTPDAHGQDRKFGLGGIISGPNGISAKAWLSEDMAVAAALGFSIHDDWGFVQVHADVLMHKPFNLDDDAGSLYLYYGGGLGLYTTDGYDEIYIRIPVGISYGISNLPFDVFFETVPYAVVDPQFSIQFEGAVGFRYFF